jgi:[NiFe] hydrogenase assembly HybE family chaperone
VTIAAADLCARYEWIHAERMCGLPILNPALRVATIGFREHGTDAVGVLVTPWFMNLVVLPDDDSGCQVQGDRVDYALPGGVLEMTVHCDDELGGYLSVVLYRDVMAIPDMACAQTLAADILHRLFDAQAATAELAAARRVTRRSLFAGPDRG